MSAGDSPIDRSLARASEKVATFNRRMWPLLLVVLCLAVYLPGAIRLPAVDRTEIVYAETTRSMVERGALADPRYGETVHQFRPIGTYWAQAAAAAVAGEANASNITVYRLPGVLAVTLAVLALYLLARPLGINPLYAAALFAVAPLTVLLSQLAITEGLALLPATVAMLSLMRLYAAKDGDNERALALLLWISIGFGLLLNALQTPILMAATLIALFVMDRDLSWLKRTLPLIGLPIALVIAAPWLLVRWHQDGVPFAGMGWSEFLAALGGSQDMKLKAWPGTFVLAALLGFLPGTALLAPAVRTLWQDRGADRVARFLLAWMIGYIVYLELVSSKPGTYTVQVMFPAFALAVARIIPEMPVRPLPEFHAIPWPPLAALFALGLFAAVYKFAGAVPGPVALAGIAATAAMFYMSADAGRKGLLWLWVVQGTAALAVFAVTLLAVVLPSIEKIWPAQTLTAAVRESCGEIAPAVTVLGFREPSAYFVLGAPHAPQSPEATVANGAAVRIVESRWLNRYFVSYAARNPGKLPGRALGCVAAYNVMRGCPLSFTMFAPENAPENAAACKPAASFRCDSDERAAPRDPARGCD